MTINGIHGGMLAAVFNELQPVANGDSMWLGWVITHGDDGIQLLHTRSGASASLTCALNEGEVDGPQGTVKLSKRERNQVEHIEKAYAKADLDDSLIENRIDI